MPLAPKSVTGGQALRLALLGGTYVRWLGLFLAIGVAVSAMAGRTGRAMLVLAGTDLAHHRHFAKSSQAHRLVAAS